MCVCVGDKCNGEKATFPGGNGGGGNSKASSLNLTATGAGLMKIMQAY